MNRNCSCCYFQPAKCTHYKNPEKECWFLIHDKTNGDRIREMVATDAGLADLLIKCARTDEGQDLYSLWCDNKGSCQNDPEEGCREEWLKACVIRWIRARAKEKPANDHA